MKKIWFLALLVAALAPATFGQDVDDYNKVEVYGGYSLGRFKTNLNSASFTSGGGTQTFSNLCSSTTGEMIGPNFQKFFCERRNFNGFDASVTYNVTKYVGVKGDLTGHFKSEAFVDNFTPPGVTQTVGNKERLYNFLVGLQVKNNTKTARLKPFGHALAGVARYTNTQQQTLDLFPQFNFTIKDRMTSFAMKLGGGLDIRAGKRIDIRVFEFDYNPVFAKDRRPKSIAGPFTDVSFTGATAHNFTIGFGVVIH
jgi:opacity protein-like surface antigen